MLRLPGPDEPSTLQAQPIAVDLRHDVREAAVLADLRACGHGTPKMRAKICAPTSPVEPRSPAAPAMPMTKS